MHSEVSQNDLLNPKSAELIIDAQQITPESRLNITFYKGSAKAKVISIEKAISNKKDH